LLWIVAAFSVGATTFIFLERLAFALSGSWATTAILFAGSFFILGLVAYFILSLRKLQWDDLWSVSAKEVERQSAFFTAHPEMKSEFVTAVSELKTSAHSNELLVAHQERWQSLFSQFAVELLPPRSIFLPCAAALLALSLWMFTQQGGLLHLPQQVVAWGVTQYEVLPPYGAATWTPQSGRWVALKGSRFRFPPPSSSELDSIWKRFVYFQNSKGEWTAWPCEVFCELPVNESGVLAVGTWLKRSAFYPVQALEHEAPRSALVVFVGGEWVAATELELIKQNELLVEMSASDDLRLKSVKLVHEFEGVQATLFESATQEKTFKKRFNLQMADWKGGEHLVYVVPEDDTSSSQSVPLRIRYNDEESLRQKRLAEIQGLITEWVHVLGDLIDSQLEGRLHAELQTRLLQMPDVESRDESLLSAYVNELALAKSRLLQWTSNGAPLSELPSLIERVERLILYGISLVFQEKAGDLQSLTSNVSRSQADLQSMLQQLQKGELPFNSEVLDKAFQKLSDQLAELQKKIAEMPAGPNDQMINQQALQEQADEAQSLADQIEAIKRQAANGDEKGALRELESLLNQLSILTKEMDRNLNQWQQNLDQGSIQQAQKFMKDLEAIQQEQKKVLEQTAQSRQKLESLQKQSQEKRTSALEKEAAELEKQIKSLENQQEGIGQKFQEAREKFDQALEGSEWQEMMRGSENQAMENEIAERMIQSEQGLNQWRLLESETQQQETLQLMQKLQENQQRQMQQLQNLSQGSGTGLEQKEKVEIIGNEGGGERERRRRILESMKQKVGPEYQRSHERYFEDLLQR
jgi:hypothetical protein